MRWIQFSAWSAGDPASDTDGLGLSSFAPLGKFFQVPRSAAQRGRQKAPGGCLSAFFFAIARELGGYSYKTVATKPHHNAIWHF